ncbi:MAG: hypothetical protein K0R80_1598 [Clostridia bacterium]|jgi:hypothetical protein|nr:hypothetical protein [Clostridia bacterium]
MNNSDKKEYIIHLSDSVRIIANTNKKEESDLEPILTFATSFGYVVGRISSYKPFETVEYEKFHEEVANRISAKEGVGIMEITDFLVKAKEKKLGHDIDSTNLYLSDVVVYNFDRKELLTSNFYILFVDQIVGVIPALLV